MIAFVVIGLGTSSAATPQPQLDAAMTIPGIPGQIRFLADRTDWTQIEGMPDPRGSHGSGSGNLLGSRSGSLLTSRGSPGGGDKGSVDMQDFSITKNLDDSSPKIHDACSAGTHFGEAVLEVRNAGGAPGDLLMITMRNAVITRVDRQPAVGRDGPTETVTFKCQTIEWESRPAAASPRASPAYPITPRPR
jgi:type VI protein secretion system component Hcp